MTKYLYMDDKKIAGPVDLAAIRAALETGAINEETQVCYNGDSRWKALREFGEIAGTAVPSLNRPVAALPNAGQQGSPPIVSVLHIVGALAVILGLVQLLDKGAAAGMTMVTSGIIYFALATIIEYLVKIHHALKERQ